jgi:uncharacterized protein (DUF3084 family)
MEYDSYPTLEECIENAFYHETHSDRRYTFDPSTVCARRTLTAEEQERVNTLVGPLRLESIRVKKLEDEKDELISKRGVHERNINTLRSALMSLQSELTPEAYQARCAKIDAEYAKISEYNLQIAKLEEEIHAK